MLEDPFVQVAAGLLIAYSALDISTRLCIRRQKRKKKVK